MKHRNHVLIASSLLVLALAAFFSTGSNLIRNALGTQTRSISVEPSENEQANAELMALAEQPSDREGEGDGGGSYDGGGSWDDSGSGGGSSGGGPDGAGGSGN